jgi:asparagine synthase (glutamine-hydrolysing)
MNGLDVAFPFLDRDLVEFLMGVPGELLARDGVPKALLREALRGVVPEQILQRTWKADFTEIVNEGTRRDYPRIVELLGPDPLAAQLGYVEADSLKRGLARARAEVEEATTCTASWSLTGLLALELWLREFFGGREPEQEMERWAHNGRATARAIE